MHRNDRLKRRQARKHRHELARRALRRAYHANCQHNRHVEMARRRSRAAQRAKAYATWVNRNHTVEGMP